MRRLALALLPLALLGLAACKGTCRELSERICDCEPSSTQRDTCKRVAGQAESVAGPTADDEARCEQLLTTCPATQEPQNCGALETDEGKRACGLAR